MFNFKAQAQGLLSKLWRRAGKWEAAGEEEANELEGKGHGSQCSFPLNLSGALMMMMKVKGWEASRAACTWICLNCVCASSSLLLLFGSVQENFVQTIMSQSSCRCHWNWNSASQSHQLFKTPPEKEAKLLRFDCCCFWCCCFCLLAPILFFTWAFQSACWFSILRYDSFLICIVFLASSKQNLHLRALKIDFCCCCCCFTLTAW